MKTLSKLEFYTLSNQFKTTSFIAGQNTVANNVTAIVMFKIDVR